MAWGDKKAEPQTGLEMGLRFAMKLAGVNSEEVFGQIKKFAEDGSLERIIAFADAIEFNNFLMGTIYNEFRKQSPDMPDIASAYGEFKSRSRSGNGGPEQSSSVRLTIASGSNPSV